MNVKDWRIVGFDEVESTNDEALKYSRKANGASYVIIAKRQTKGRGRRGRSWVGLDGNLFFSVLLEFDVKNLGALVIISALSLLQCIKSLKSDVEVLLKWPNDVLLNGAKVSGILLEKANGNYMIVGVGVNIKHSPHDISTLYPVISLKEADIDTESGDFLRRYLKFFGDNINLYRGGGFEKLRQLWLSNAKGIGERITVRQENDVKEGLFRGIDENADLLLEKNGVISKIVVGDVFYEG